MIILNLYHQLIHGMCKLNIKSDFNKLKTLEVTINKGQIIFIPAYWWYSVWFNDNSKFINI